MPFFFAVSIAVAQAPAEPATDAALQLINELRQKGGAILMKADPALTDQARKVVAEFIASGKADPEAVIKADVPKLVRQLKAKGHPVEELKVTAKRGKLETVLPTILAGSLRDKDTLAATTRYPALVGAARGTTAGGEEFFVILYEPKNLPVEPAKGKARGPK